MFSCAWLVLAPLVLGVLGSSTPAHAGSGGSVDLVILLEQGTQPTAAQKWLKLLTELKVDGLSVQIRQSQGGDKPGVSNEGTVKSPRYRVVGQLRAGGKLVLGNKTFSSRDTARLRQYFESLQDAGVEGVTQRRGPFGMTRGQLTEVSEELTPTISFSTVKLTPSAAIRKLQSHIRMPIVVRPEAREALSSSELVGSELEGLTAGTAMAIILDRVGLRLVPERVSGKQQLAIAPAEAGGAAWPVGWPPEAKAAKLVPVLFEFVNVEIDKIPLDETLAALSERLKLRFVFDHRAIAADKLDLTKPVSIPAGRSFYLRIVEKSLAQAGLKGELRVDDLEQPFYWITTIMPAKAQR